MITFRPTTKDDAPLIGTWILADEDHRDKMDATFFTTPDDRSTVYAVEDEEGPVIFVRQEIDGMATRLHTQFPPDSRKRVAKALLQGYPAVAADAKQRGFKAVVFDSVSPALIRFMLRFGFVVQMRHEF